MTGGQGQRHAGARRGESNIPGLGDNKDNMSGPGNKEDDVPELRDEEDNALGPRDEHDAPGLGDKEDGAWGPGDKVYWDNTNKRATKIATDNTLVGVALSVVGSGTDETTGRVRLNGSF